jgi:hypothetical protein
VDPKARAALLYNEGLIAKGSGDATAARAYLSRSLALRGPTDPGRKEVELAFSSVGGQIPAAGSACITFHPAEKDFPNGGPVEVEGVVKSVQVGHPNGSTFTAFILELPTPRCVEGLSGTRSVLEVQLTGDYNEELKLVGKRIHVQGDAYPEMTAWHIRPVLVSPTSIETL